MRFENGPTGGMGIVLVSNLLSQWLNFKLFGIPYLVGKIGSSNIFFSAE